MDPLLSLAALAANVKHTVRCDGKSCGRSQIREEEVVSCILYTQLAHSESSLVDTGGFCARAKHIVDIGDIVWRSYPFGLLKETEETVMYQHRRPFNGMEQG